MGMKGTFQIIRKVKVFPEVSPPRSWFIRAMGYMTESLYKQGRSVIQKQIASHF